MITKRKSRVLNICSIEKLQNQSEIVTLFRVHCGVDNTEEPCAYATSRTILLQEDASLRVQVEKVGLKKFLNVSYSLYFQRSSWWLYIQKSVHRSVCSNEGFLDVQQWIGAVCSYIVHLCGNNEGSVPGNLSTAI